MLDTWARWDTDDILRLFEHRAFAELLTAILDTAKVPRLQLS
jgi:hypothetical protein